MKLINIVIFSLVVSGCAKKSMSERGDWVVKKIIRKIELDDLQAAKLWAVKHEYFKIRGDKKKQRDDHFNKILKFVKAQDITQREIKEYIDEGRKMDDDYLPKLFPFIKDLQNSLSKKQKEEIVTWARELRERFDL